MSNYSVNRFTFLVHHASAILTIHGFIECLICHYDICIEHCSDQETHPIEEKVRQGTDVHWSHHMSLHLKPTSFREWEGQLCLNWEAAPCLNGVPFYSN